MTDHRIFRVMVVDDEPLIASTAAKILGLGGFAPESFTYPLAALARAQIDAPDVLLSDVAMPQMSGIELAIQITSLCPGCRVILLSGQATNLDLIEMAKITAHDFQLLQKPIPPSELLAFIRQRQVCAAPLPPVQCSFVPAAMTQKANSRPQN